MELEPDFLRWLYRQPAGYINFLYTQYQLSQQVKLVIMPQEQLDQLLEGEMTEQELDKLSKNPISYQDINELKHELNTNGLKHLTSPED